MKFYSDETIILGRTYNETTPESVAEGDFSESGWVFQDVEHTVDEFVHLIDSELMTCESSTWLSTDWYTTCYKTGTDRQESIHLGNEGITERMREIFQAALDGKLDVTYVDDMDDTELAERSHGLPVSFHNIQYFNEAQGSLAL